MVCTLHGYTSKLGCKLKSMMHYLVLTTEGPQIIALTLLYDKMLFNYIPVSYELRTKNGLYKKLAGCPTRNFPS